MALEIACLLSVGFSHGAFAYDLNNARVRAVCSGFAVFNFEVPELVQSVANDGRYDLVAEVLNRVRSIYPQYGPYSLATINPATPEADFQFAFVDGTQQVATCVLSIGRAAVTVDPVVAAVNDVRSELQAGNSWASQIRSDTQTTANRVTEIRADVGALRGDGQPVAVNFTSVGKYWLVCFITVMGLYLTALTAGDIIKMLRGLR
jgi:hypothetical protein